MTRGALSWPSLTNLFLSAVNAADGTHQPISGLANTSTGTPNTAVAASTNLSACAALKMKEGLKFSVGPKGLVSLRYNGQELIFKQRAPNYPTSRNLRKPTERYFNQAMKRPVVGECNTVTQTFSWGSVK
jgi:hypothetical protein